MLLSHLLHVANIVPTAGHKINSYSGKGRETICYIGAEFLKPNLLRMSTKWLFGNQLSTSVT